jgi:hypothetical protein
LQRSGFSGHFQIKIRIKEGFLFSAISPPKEAQSAEFTIQVYGPGLPMLHGTWISGVPICRSGHWAKSPPRSLNYFFSFAMSAYTSP